MMRLLIEPAARDEIVKLPGHMRQRVRRAVNDLREAPRPSSSCALDIPDDLRIEGVEVRRLQLDHWRVVYTIDTEWNVITVLAVRKRPHIQLRGSTGADGTARQRIMVRGGIRPVSVGE